MIQSHFSPSPSCSLLKPLLSPLSEQGFSTPLQASCSLLTPSLSPLSEQGFSTPLQASCPLLTPLLSPLSEQSFSTPLQVSCSAQDRIFHYLFEKKILDENGNLNVNLHHLSAPLLSDIQTERLNTLLKMQFTVKSKNDSFEFETSLEELFLYLGIHKIEIIGGTVSWILGREYMEELALALDIPKEMLDENFFAEFEKPAADIDIRVPCLEDPKIWQEYVCDFFAMKLEEEQKDLVESEAFTKYYIHHTNDDHFGITSFGNRYDFSIDLLFVKDLKRKNLFKHDAIKLDISYLNTPFRTLKLNSHDTPIVESLILKLVKILQADDIDGINLPGCTMLFSYLTKGWRFYSEELENTLVSKLLASQKYELLEKTIKNHFPNDPLAPLAFYFNASYLMPQDGIINLSDCTYSGDHVLKLLNDAMRLFPLKINLITHFLQLMGSLFCLHKAKGFKKDVDVNFTNIRGAPHLQFKFQSLSPLYIIIKNDLNSYEKDLLTLDKELLCFLEKISEHFIFYPETGFKVTDITHEAVNLNLQEHAKIAFELLGHKNIFFKQLGFYLLCSYGIQEKTAKNLPHLLDKFFELIKTEVSISSKKNLLYLFIKYWILIAREELQNSESEIENFYKAISNANCKLDDILRSFCLNFAKVKNPHVIHHIFKIWDTQRELFNEASYFSLVEKFSEHSPRNALKILQGCIEKYPKIIPKAQKAFNPILDWYLNEKNEIFLQQDLIKLSDVATKIVSEKQENTNNYLKLVHTLLELDFTKGMLLLKTFEDKKIVSHGFLQILKQTAEEKKQKLVLQWNENAPLDFFTAPASLLEERLEALLQVNETTWIFDFLEKFLNRKNLPSKKLKDILKPKLEPLLIQLLSEPDKNIHEALLFYFKIAKVFYPEIIYKSSLTALALQNFNQILESKKSLETVLFIKENIDSKNMSSDELLLYENLIETALLLKETKVAEELIRNILFYLRSKSKTPLLKVLQFFEELLNQQKDNTLPLLSFMEKLFPDIHILNEREHWKAIALSEKDNIKKMTLLCKKATIFANDNEMLLAAEKLLFDSLPLSKNDMALNLIESYQLSSKSFIETLSTTLLELNNKAVCKSVFLTLQKIKVPPTKLLSLFKVLSVISPEFYIEYLNKYKSILAEFKADTDLKQDFTDLLISSFLKLLTFKSPNLIKIYDAFLFIEMDQQKDLNLKFVQNFMPFLSNAKINETFWKKLQYLFKKTETPVDVKELIVHLLKALAFFEKTLNFQEILEQPLTLITLEIMNKIDVSNIPELLEPFAAHNSHFSLDLCSCILDKVVKALSERKIKRTDNAYIPFKTFLKKIISLSLEQKLYGYLSTFISPLFFDKKESYELNGLFANTFFNDENAILKEVNIIGVLDVFLLGFQSPHESPQFQESNLKMAVDHLLALIFTFDNDIVFFTTFTTIVKSFSIYMENKEYYFDFMTALYKENGDLEGEVLAIYLNENNSKLYSKSASDIKIMQEKFYRFLLLLTEKISEKVSTGNVKLTTSLLNVILNASRNLLCLTHLFPEKKEDIVSAVLNYGVATTHLHLSVFDKSLIWLNGIFLKMKTQNFFQETLSTSFLEKSFQLMVFTESSSDAFDVLTDKQMAAAALLMLKQIWHSKTLHSFAFTLHYAKHCNEILKLGLPKEYELFEKAFFLELKNKFPNLSKDPKKYLEDMLVQRNNSAIYLSPK